MEISSSNDPLENIVSSFRNETWLFDTRLAPSLITTIAYRDDATFPRRWNPATGLWDPDKRRDVTISCEREKRSGGERSSAANRKLATSRGNYRSEIWIIFLFYASFHRKFHPQWRFESGVDRNTDFFGFRSSTALAAFT